MTKPLNFPVKSPLAVKNPYKNAFCRPSIRPKAIAHPAIGRSKYCL